MLNLLEKDDVGESTMEEIRSKDRKRIKKEVQTTNKEDAGKNFSYPTLFKSLSGIVLTPKRINE